MTVKIITDSLGDVPSKVAEELDIAVIPITVLFGTEVYRDGVDLSTQQFYDKLIQGKRLPTTAVPSLGTFIETYNKLAEETDEILVITISHKLSATYEMALQATRQLKKRCQVEVIDSQWVIMGQGLIVITAAKAAKNGASLDEVINLTRHNMSRVDLRMAFDTLEYLKKGGRIGKGQAFLGSMLRVNSILGVKDGGVVPFARERSRTKAIDYLYDFVMSYSHIDEMAVEDATTPDEAEALVERLNPKFPKERIYRSKVSPVVGAHVGPRVLSVSVLGDKNKH